MVIVKMPERIKPSFRRTLDVNQCREEKPN